MRSTLLRAKAAPGPKRPHRGPTPPVPLSSLLEKYEWVAAEKFGLQDGCITAVTGLSPAAVAKELRAHEAASQSQWAVTRAVPGAVIVIESLAYRGAQVSLLKRLSRAGRAASVARCEELETRISLVCANIVCPSV